MTIVISGSGLGIEDVVQVARTRERIALAADAETRMVASRAAVDEALERGEVVYGLTTGVGALRREQVAIDELSWVGERLLISHSVGQGRAADRGSVRATAVCLLNFLAQGTSGVRPEVAQGLVRMLAEDRLPDIPELGSIGQADLAPLAPLAEAILREVPPAPGEALALIDNNAFATASGALALYDTHRLLRALEVTGALSLEAFAANVAPLDPAVVAARPFSGLAESARRLRDLLDGSFLNRPGASRNLQDPLTFRGIAHVLGALRDALAFARAHVEVELNAHQGNPFVALEGGQIRPAANFEVLPLAQAMDLARIALAPALSAAQERALKLLDTPWSGLPTGLAPSDGTDSGMSMLGIVAQALTAEARLLAQPVSFELTSTTGAEGIEDRMTMAPLGARRLAEMVVLGERIAAIELVVAAQAADLRDQNPLGLGTRQARRFLRDHVPFMEHGGRVPADHQPLRELLRSDAFAALGD